MGRHRRLPAGQRQLRERMGAWLQQRQIQLRPFHQWRPHLPERLRSVRDRPVVSRCRHLRRLADATVRQRRRARQQQSAPWNHRLLAGHVRHRQLPGRQRVFSARRLYLRGANLQSCPHRPAGSKSLQQHKKQPRQPTQAADRGQQPRPERRPLSDVYREGSGGGTLGNGSADVHPPRLRHLTHARQPHQLG